MKIQKIYGILDLINMINIFKIIIKFFKKINPKDVLNKIKEDYEKKKGHRIKIKGDYSILAYKLAKFDSEWNYKDKITILSDLLNQ